MSEQVIIEIDESGNAVVSVKGVKGAGCAALTNAIESALGKKSKDTKTPEWSEKAVAAAQVGAGR